MAILGLTVFSTYLLLVNFFTNRSLYSFLALVLFASFCYRFLRIIFVYLFDFWGQYNSIFFFSKEFWIKQVFAIGLDLAVTAICFYLLNLVSKSLKPVFLFNKAAK